MSERKEAKLEIKKLSKPVKISKDKLSQFKGILSARSLGRLKLEAVDCPVNNITVSFLDCFLCHRFVRRVKGYVHCAV